MAAKKKTAKSKSPATSARAKAPAKATKASKTTKKPTRKASAKPATAKPVVARRKAADKVPTRKATSGKAPTRKAPSARTATIVARVDVGFGNALFLRGAGTGLSWGRGVRMECVGANEWRLTVDCAAGPFQAKTLRNDDEWAQGDNFVVDAGEIVVEPKF